jgi:hypothetical protein
VYSGFNGTEIITRNTTASTPFILYYVLQHDTARLRRFERLVQISRQILVDVECVFF